MMNGVGGTTLHYWAQSWRLNPWDFKSSARRRAATAPARVPAGSTVEDWPFGARRARALLRQGRVRARRVGPSRQRQGRASIRAATSSKARARGVSDAAAARHRVHGPHGPRPRAGSAGIRSPGPRPINSELYQNRSACLYHGFCNRGGCHVSREELDGRVDDPARAKRRAASTSSPKRTSRASTSTPKAAPPACSI